jgi:NitT/TauT family transport system substrate-binding protein
MKSRMRLTLVSKILLFVLLIGGLSGLAYKTGTFTKAANQVKGLFGSKESESTLPSDSDQAYEKAGEINKQDGVMNLSLDEWVGWKSIIDANGGLTTQKGSIYDKLGLKLNISVINDATQSSNALIKGDLNGAGYTVNRYSFLYPKFKSAGVPVDMAYVTNSSTGGDGIIAKKGINKIEDLVGKKIGVPRFSEAQTLVEWLMSKSSLSQDQIADIRKNMVMFETPDDAAKAFFAGQLDAAATWQPYLSQATETTDAHILFSTKDATNIIMDGIVFRQDYLNSNKDNVTKLVQGALQAQSMYATETKAIKNTFPMFATSTDEDVKGMTGDATLTNCASNISVLAKGGTARNLFTDMSNVWKSVGETADPTAADNAFDDSIVNGLKDKFPSEKAQTVQFTEDQRTAAKSQDNNQALLSKKLSVTFETGSASIAPESYATLGDFANTAKILNGTVIQIEGNTDNVGDAASNKALSEKRAKAVAFYLQSQGVDNTRFVVVGNGQDNPVADNGTDAGKAANRRTDVYFKVVK